MEAKYTLRQYEAAGRDCDSVYDLAESKIKLGVYPVSREALMNAFQVFRYAFQDWARTKEEGVVLRALMYRENRSREVTRTIPQDEMEIYVEDEQTAEEIERILKKDGYEEDGQ